MKYQVSESTQFLLSTPISIAGVKLFQELTVKQFLWGYQDAHFAAMKSAMDCKSRNHEIFISEIGILFCHYILGWGYPEYAERIPDEVGLFVGVRRTLDAALLVASIKI